MKKLAISCDSVCVLPEKAREYGFTMAPFSIVIDGKHYLDTEIDMDELYTALERQDDLPTTSMPNVGEFEQLFTRLAEDAEAVLHIAITSVFSAAYKNAMQARERLAKRLPGTRIEVVDSRTTGMGVCLLTREALRFSSQGENIDQVLSRSSAACRKSMTSAPGIPFSTWIRGDGYSRRNRGRRPKGRLHSAR
jgi:DegV family protein with EDD domain